MTLDWSTAHQRLVEALMAPAWWETPELGPIMRALAVDYPPPLPCSPDVEGSHVRSLVGVCRRCSAPLHGNCRPQDNPDFDWGPPGTGETITSRPIVGNPALH